MADLWTAEQLPNLDPEPDDDAGPWCGLPWSTLRDLRGQHADDLALLTLTTIQLAGRWL